MFEGKQIKLRANKIDDIEKNLELFNEENFRDTYTIGSIFPMTYEFLKDFIEKNLIPNNELFNFAIEARETKEFVGRCCIYELDRKNSVAFIGMWIGKKYHGRGFGSDALRVLCNFIFEEMNIHKISLFYFEFNKAAKFCYESIGFKEEGRNRKELYRYGEYHDIIKMGLFKDELILKK